MRKLLFADLLMGYILATFGQQDFDTLSTKTRLNEHGRLFVNLDLSALVIPDAIAIAGDFVPLLPVFNPKPKLGVRYGISKYISLEVNGMVWGGRTGIGWLSNIYLNNNDQKKWTSYVKPENGKGGLFQFRGLTSGYGAEFKILLSPYMEERKFFLIDFQRGKANDVRWVEYYTNRYDNIYLVDIVSTRVAFTYGIEFMPWAIGKNYFLAFSIGGGLIANFKQIYTKRWEDSYYGTLPPEGVEYHRTSSAFTPIPHLDLGLKFHFKVK